MKNEKMNQQEQPTYEQVVQAYNNLVKDFETLRMELNAVKTDKLLEKLGMMLAVIKEKDSYPENIVNLAEWHIKKMMAKSKN